MTPPPEAPEVGNAATGTAPPAVSVCPPPTLTTLRKRADFLRAARARRQGSPGMMVQARRRAPEEPGEGIRVGYTCSKKVGNAVARNRAKRRLREVARIVLPEQGRDGWDYVLIGRAGVTAQRPWPDLIRDLERALVRLHAAA